MASCPRCECLPQGCPDPGVLYLQPPLKVLRDKLLAVCHSLELETECQQQALLLVHVRPAQLLPLARALDPCFAAAHAAVACLKKTKYAA